MSEAKRKMVSLLEGTSTREIDPYFLIGYLRKTIDFSIEYAEGDDIEETIACLKRGLEVYDKFRKQKGWDE